MSTKVLIRTVLAAGLVFCLLGAESRAAKKDKPSGDDEVARFSIVELELYDPRAISDVTPKGVWIVGDTPDPVYTQAYVWHRDASGQVTSGFLPGGGTASDVNESGDVVGGPALWTLDAEDEYQQQFLDPLELFGNVNARAINNSRTVVGSFNAETGSGAFVWSEETGIVELEEFLSPADAAAWHLRWGSAVNDSEVVAGQGLLDGVYRGFVLNLLTGSVVAVPLIDGAVQNSCTSINELGHVGGWTKAADGSTRAFFWEGPGHAPVDLGNMGHDGAVGSAVNNLQQVAGHSTIDAVSPSDIRFIATLWESDGQSWSGLALETQIPPPGRKEPYWVLEIAWGMNNDGWIVGHGYQVGKWQITAAGFLLIPND